MTLTAWNPTVSIALDTRPPTLTVSASKSVAAPATWDVVITSSEEIGGWSLVFIDSLGIEHPVGGLLSGFGLIIALPSGEVATGPGWLTGWVDDLACNSSPVRQPLIVDRPPPFQVMMTVGHAFDAEVTMSDAVDASLDFERAFDTNEEQAHAVDGEMTVERAVDATLDLDVGDAG